MLRSLLAPIVASKGDLPLVDVGFRVVDSIEKIREKEAVVIGRSGMKVPEGWELVVVSTVKGYYGPRELNRLLEGIVESLKRNPNRAIIISCPEYLVLHNGFESFLKFLHTVRDYAILYGGRVYLVTDPSSWIPREYALLKTLET